VEEDRHQQPEHPSSSSHKLVSAHGQEEATTAAPTSHNHPSPQPKEETYTVGAATSLLETNAPQAVKNQVKIFRVPTIPIGPLLFHDYSCCSCKVRERTHTATFEESKVVHLPAQALLMSANSQSHPENATNEGAAKAIQRPSKVLGIQRSMDHAGKAMEGVKIEHDPAPAGPPASSLLKTTPSEQKRKKVADSSEGEDSDSGERGKNKMSRYRQAVAQLDLNTGEVVSVYESQGAASDAFHKCHSGISHCVRGRTRSAHGFKWRVATPEEISANLEKASVQVTHKVGERVQAMHDGKWHEAAVIGIVNEGGYVVMVEQGEGENSTLSVMSNEIKPLKKRKLGPPSMAKTPSCHKRKRAETIAVGTTFNRTYGNRTSIHFEAGTFAGRVVSYDADSGTSGQYRVLYTEGEEDFLDYDELAEHLKSGCSSPNAKNINNVKMARDEVGVVAVALPKKTGRSSKAVAQLDLDTSEVISVYDSQSAAARSCHGAEKRIRPDVTVQAVQSGISQCCTGKRTSSHGFKWRFAAPEEARAHLEKANAKVQNPAPCSCDRYLPSTPPFFFSSFRPSPSFLLSFLPPSMPFFL
jgi:hypothetical protein